MERLLSQQYIRGVPFNWPQYGPFISPVFYPEELLDNTPTKKPIFGGTAHILWEFMGIFAEATGQKKPELKPMLTGFPQQG